MRESDAQSFAEPLLSYFEKSFPLNEEEKELVRARFNSRLFRKRQFVLQEGNVCAQFNFVVRGCLRSYKIDEKGHTYILQFAYYIRICRKLITHNFNHGKIYSILGFFADFSIG